MLHNALLIIRNPDDDETIGIPVLNFPITPVGAQVDLCQWLWSDLTVVGYSASDTYGTSVYLAAHGQDSKWHDVAARCVPDPLRFVNHIYPDEVQFEPAHTQF